MSKTLLCGALVASACAALCNSAGAMVVNLVQNQSGAAAGALFYRADFQSAGTGVIDPFVRIQHDNAPPNNGHSLAARSRDTTPRDARSSTTS